MIQVLPTSQRRVGKYGGAFQPGVFTDFYPNPVCRTPLTIAANSAASLVACAGGPEVVGPELQTGSLLTGTGGSGGGGGTVNGDVADGLYVLAGAGTTATCSKEAVTDDQIIASSVGTSILQDDANSISFTINQQYRYDIIVDKIVGTCQASVASNAGTNIQVAAFTLLQGTNRLPFKAASTNVGTIRIHVPAGGSIVIRKMGLNSYSPTNYLRASVNTGSGIVELRKVVAGVVTSLISAANPVQNKNYAPVGCCTDPNWDLNVTTGWSSWSSGLLSSVAGGATGFALRITEPGTASTPAAAKQVTVKPGEIWKFKGKVKAGTEATYRVGVFNVAGLATIWYPAAAEAANDWSTVWEQDVTIPADCVSIYIILYQNCAAGSGTYIDFDDVSFTKTSTDDLILVVDKTNPASAAVSLFHDGVQVGTTQAVTDAAILNGRYHYLSGDYGSSVLYKRRFALGPEIATGTTTAGKIYKITATQTNYFFTGCAVGNIFMAYASKTFDANNKAQEIFQP